MSSRIVSTTKRPSINVFPASPIAAVSPYIYSGFLEHLGRCIYGGIVPSSKTTFPYTPRKPCPNADYVETPAELITKDGFRKDVLGLIRDELQVPMVRWPGGNYVSSYRWKDGIGPKDARPRRPELAWAGEESNQFGTDEFIAWCRAANCEPYIIVNMGTGTLEDALDWVEYCNGTGDTHYADLRRKHTGKDEPYDVKYWGLGNEVWGPWQVGQLSAEEYAKIARRWAHAIKLIDPSIKLIACGETGETNWDSTVLDELADKIDGHSIHLYAGLGPRDRTEVEKEYGRYVYGPDAGDFGINVCRGLIMKARLLKQANHPIKIAYDEYGVWDETIGTAANGLEQFYNLQDAITMASWLNVFIRNADVVNIACIAQSVNVISPIITSPTSLFKQTIYHPLHLFSNHMRDGESLHTSVLDNPTFSGETLPRWISTIKGPPHQLDVSAVLHTPSESGPSKPIIALSVVNRDEFHPYETDINFSGYKSSDVTKVDVYEMWHEDVKARNGWGPDLDKVAVTKRVLRHAGQWTGTWVFKEHSFTLFVVEFSKQWYN